MRLLVSACLLGLCTRFDGKGSACEELLKLKDRHELIPVCPEQLGGMPTPRSPGEICGDRVLNREGQDVTASFLLGAEQAVFICRLSGCSAAVLKQRSPSCGKGLVYDGSFQGRLVPGPGILAARLINAGVPVYGEDELHLLSLDTPHDSRP